MGIGTLTVINKKTTDEWSCEYDFAVYAVVTRPEIKSKGSCDATKQFLGNCCSQIFLNSET